jgi:paraquat-inducible protein A
MPGVLLLAAAPMLVAGLTMPAISVSRLVFFEQQYSLMQAILAYWSQGQWALFILVLVFSVLIPASKVLIGLWAWVAGQNRPQLVRRMLRVLAAISKWSMLDVFIVALTVLVVDGRILDSADVHVGIILFAAAAIASTLATQRLNRT